MNFGLPFVFLTSFFLFIPLNFHFVSIYFVHISAFYFSVFLTMCSVVSILKLLPVLPSFLRCSFFLLHLSCWLLLAILSLISHVFLLGVFIPNYFILCILFHFLKKFTAKC